MLRKRLPGARKCHQRSRACRDAGSVLVHTHDRSIDHLQRRIMSCGECIYNLVPDASPSPAFVVSAERWQPDGRACSVDLYQAGVLFQINALSDLGDLIKNNLRLELGHE